MKSRYRREYCFGGMAEIVFPKAMDLAMYSSFFLVLLGVIRGYVPEMGQNVDHSYEVQFAPVPTADALLLEGLLLVD